MSHFDIRISNRDELPERITIMLKNYPVFLAKKIIWNWHAECSCLPDKSGQQTPKKELFYLLSRVPALSPNIRNATVILNGCRVFLFRWELIPIHPYKRGAATGNRPCELPGA